MNTTQTINRNFEAIAWGALFIWWGISVLVPTLPNGTTAFGTGLILVGVNLARRLSGVPISSFSTTIGILALLWGGLELVGVLVNLPIELPIFAILLLALGVIILVPELRARKDQ
jgi:hypothetical protein